MFKELYAKVKMLWSEPLPSASEPEPDDGLSVDEVVRMCPGAKRANVAEHWPRIRRELRNAGLDGIRWQIMAAATVYTEVGGRFEPISEYPSKYNTSPAGEPFDRYDNREDLGNRGRPDGRLYKGRGYIQLTGRYNYRKYGGEALESAPELANDPDMAARLLSAFLADHRDRIGGALDRGNLKAARRAVNGGSHGLDRFSQAYRTGLDITRTA